MDCQDLEKTFKSQVFPIEQDLIRYICILNFRAQIWHFIEISAIFESTFVEFKKTKMGNLPKPRGFFLELWDIFLG